VLTVAGHSETAFPVTSVAIYDEESAKLRSEYYMETNPDHDDIISELPTFYL
jgi:hypothetical protein